MINSFDIIGDIHGYAGKLLELLLKLGYKEQAGCFRHRDRKAIFLGDLIDRGPENFKTVEIVKAMVDRERALVVMGNHEYNALCYHTKDRNGDSIRKHSEKNSGQHKTVLAEIAAGGKEKWRGYLEWFRRMPLFLEIGGIRIVHASWDQDTIKFLGGAASPADGSGRLTDEFIYESYQEFTPCFDAVETLLKGKEIPLPDGFPGILDKDGNLRRKVRLKWWLPGEQLREACTYDQVARINENSLKKLAGIKIPGRVLEELKAEANREQALDNDSPVFFGHYWFTGEPRLLTRNAACLDYSVARGGKLVCYRWDGEKILDKSKFVYV